MKSKIVVSETNKPVFNPNTAKYPVIVRNDSQVILMISKKSGVILADNNEEELNCLHILDQEELTEGWEGYWEINTQTTISFFP